MSKIIAVAAIAALLALPTVAAAETVNETLNINLHGIDTTSRAGATEALSRIDRAVTTFCTTTVPFSRIRNLDEACKSRMMDKAVAALRAPLVASLYAEDQGEHLAKRPTSWSAEG